MNAEPGHIEPVFALLRAIDRGQSIPWGPLVEALEEQKEGLAFDWAVAVLKLYLPPCTDPKRRVIESWIGELLTLRSKGRPVAEIAERASEIWYYQGARDDVQTAVAKLFAAAAAQKEGAVRGYRRDVEAALYILTKDLCPSAPERIEQLVGLYYELRDSARSI